MSQYEANGRKEYKKFTKCHHHPYTGAGSLCDGGHVTNARTYLKPVN